MKNSNTTGRETRSLTIGLTLIAIIALAFTSSASARWGGGGFSGGRWGGGGGGFRNFGGDGFGGGSFGHSSFSDSSWQHSGGSSAWNRSSSSTNSWERPSGSTESHPNGQADYNAYSANQTAEQQSRYNEANTLQENQETTDQQMHNQSVNAAYNINNNNISSGHYSGGSYYGGGYYGPYGGCCSDGGASTGEVLGAAALGAVGGMAVGSMIAANSQPQAPTTIIENNGPYGYASPPALGTSVYSLPPGAYSTQVNGSTYFISNGIYYRPFFSGNQVVYVVSEPY